jgi:hypothetical protein
VKKYVFVQKSLTCIHFSLLSFEMSATGRTNSWKHGRFPSIAASALVAVLILRFLMPETRPATEPVGLSDRGEAEMDRPNEEETSERRG